MNQLISQSQAPNMATRWEGDVECYSNFFCVSFIDHDSTKEITFEISERKNDLKELYSFIKSQLKYFISFNGMHYDNIMVMYLYSNYSSLENLDAERINKALKQLNDLVILTDDNDRVTQQKFQRYRRGHPWETIDLFLYWSKMTRISKKLSLKSVAVNMNWHRIQELPLGSDQIVPLDQMDAIIEYNLNDCRITKELATRMKKDINLRVEAKKRYGFHCLSWDGVKLGYNILLKRYCDRTGADLRQVKELRTPRSTIDIGALILPVIGFKTGSTIKRQYIEKKALVTEFSSFHGLHMYLKSLTVKSTSEINCRVFHNGVRYDVLSGGLHTKNASEVITPKPGWNYRDIDVNGFYPSQAIEWKMIPEHLPGLDEELSAQKDERMDLKSQGLGKSTGSELIKLSSNGGFYGNTNNEHTAMYDPRCTLNICVNGQLLLLMLCEQLTDLGVIIDMANTDGLTILYDKSLEKAVSDCISSWEKMSRMTMESVNYLKVARMNINNYCAIYDDNGKPGVKLKGMFLTEPPVDMSRDNLVIPKALYAYFTQGIPVEKFIREHNVIYDFCACQKVDKKYSVWHGGKRQQRLNRYFVTKSGAYLYKSEDGIAMSNLLAGHPIRLFNDYYKAPIEEYKVDYSYYVAEAKKLLNQLEPNQLSMF